MLRSLFLVMLTALAVIPIYAEEPPASKDQVDWSEVARWGDRVVESGTGARTEAGEIYFTMAMAPPEDDSDMWYITVWGMKTCPACKTLLAAFEKDDNLTPFVAVPPGKKKAWAHFNYYQVEDPTQKFRFEDFKTGAGPFPIITIQPPRNKVFGDPRVVVDRIEARDYRNPEQLRKRIITSIDLWCKKLQQSGYQPPIQALDHYGYRSDGYGHQQVAPVASDTAAKKNEPISGPWGPDPPPNPNFNPQFPFGPTPTQQPSVAPQFPSETGGWFENLFSGKAAAFYLLIIAGLRTWESVGPLFGFNPGLAKMIRELVEKMVPTVPPATPVMLASTPGTASPQYPMLLADGRVLLADGQIVGPSPSLTTK